MSFIDRIFSIVWDISDFFLYLSYDARGIPLVGDFIADWLYIISRTFWDLLTPIAHFGDWVNDITDKIESVVTLDAVWDYFRWWFDAAEIAYGWLLRWQDTILNFINTWWSTARQEVLSWIADLESWTTAQLNSLQATLTTLVTDLEAWTSTQLNNLQATFAALIADVERWTLTQINSAKTAILAIIGDLETWTITEVNTIRNILTTLIDWPALTTWITGWWNERLLDIQALINTAFLVREDFWAGWQDWRGKVTEFFTDPEDWLYKSVDRIIERFW